MTLVLADRVRDTTTTTGTGTVTLSGTAPTGYQNFSVVGDGNTTYYTISGGSQWETGIGTYSSTGPTLTRTTVLASSNSGSLVNFSAGTKDVFVTYPAEKSVNYDDNGQVVIGVGGASDTALLDVEGNIYAASAIRAGGGIDLPAGFGNYWRASLPSGAYQGGLTYNGGLRFYSGNVVNERMRITSAGNVGIGTTAPSNQLSVGGNTSATISFDWTGDSAAKASIITDFSTGEVRYGAVTNYFPTFYAGNAERMRIDTSGNVGIGTSSPGVVLDIAGDSVRVTRASGLPPAFLGRQSGGTLASPTATVSGNQLLAIGSNGHTGAAYTASPAAAIRYLALENFTSTANGTGIVFETTPVGSSTASRAEVVRIDGSGNVGIGTTTMAGRFNVTGATTNLLYGVSSTNNAALKLVANSDVNTICNVQNSGGNLLLGSNGTGEYMRINTSGNVGIGTASPTSLLDVNGNAEVNGTLFLGASNHGNIASDTNTLYLRGTNIAFQNAAGSGTYAYINSSGVLTVGGANVAIGFQSTGQQVISATTALGASNLGTNILVVTAGITLTLPTSAISGKAITISNISSGNIALSYTGSAGTDGPTTMAAGTSLMLISDGGSPPFWRLTLPFGAFDGTTMFEAGYKILPQNQRTGAYTLALSDQGKHIYATAANFNITIPANSSVAFPIGTAITIVVEDQFHTLVPAAGVTLVLAGTGAGTTGTRTLAQGSVSTIIKVGTDRWYISGSGVT